MLTALLNEEYLANKRRILDQSGVSTNWVTPITL